MPRVFLTFTLAVLAASSNKEACAVQITDLRVPQAVRNGSGSPAILDCEYSLRPDELSTESGLVVKWFFNNSPAPVYQWIPRQKPQDLGILKGKLKLDYRASHHAATMHRALYILNPTTELSGDYKCFVSTFLDEDFMIKRMVVFAPEKRMEVMQHKIGLESVNITCRAQGIFPAPELTLFKNPVDKKNREKIEGVSETTAVNGVFDVTLSTILQGEEVETTAEYGCELRIPGTKYIKSKIITYSPGSVESLSSVSGAPPALWSGGVFLCIVSALTSLAAPC